VNSIAKDAVQKTFIPAELPFEPNRT